MRIITTLTSVNGGTRLDATHEGLPDAVSESDHEMGWRDSMQTLAALCAGGAPTPLRRRNDHRVHHRAAHRALALATNPS